MAAAAPAKRPQLYKALDKCINRGRFNGWWSLLLLPYTPFGLLLIGLRLCMSLQVILMLLLVPDGKLKRFMLRISLAILGIIVTTEGKNKTPKVFVANRLSYIDNIVLHLSASCETITLEGTPPYPVTFLFSHRSLNNTDDDSLSDLLSSELNGCVDYTPLAVQPEPSPTNGSAVLKLRSWPFMIGCSIQPLAISAYRLWPVAITRASSSGWWDLFWTLFVPFTFFHIRFLESSEISEEESVEDFAVRTQRDLATGLKIRALVAGRDDIDKWLKDPPQLVVPVTQRPPSMPNGPVIPISEYKQMSRGAEGATASPQASPEIEAMVQQVTAVMPHVPHNAIRQDLLSTRSVDMTITNIIEGRVKYTSIPTLHETTDRASVSSGANVSGGVSSSSSLFGGSRSRSVHLSLQRQMSLDERKKLLLEQSRK
ncbi:lipid droplet-regulating VLDL assembly factor AUP1-like isoform X2 [Halichondria panicea]